MDTVTGTASAPADNADSCPRLERPVRVYILDDHELVRNGLRELLASVDSIEIVGDAGTAREAVHRIPQLHPDVAILDARLPDGNGIDVCREIRSIDPTIKVIILTSYDDEEALLCAITAGATGFVLKQIRGTALVDGILRAARGESLLRSDVVAQVLARLQPGPREIAEVQRLTEQERRVLEFVTAGLTSRQIADQMELSDETVTTDVSNVLAKLGMRNRTPAALFASHRLAAPGRSIPRRRMAR